MAIAPSSVAFELSPMAIVESLITPTLFPIAI